MKTKLSELADIAEIAGAFVVVISLLYVGIQVNDSASATRSAAANDANVAMQSWYQQIGSDQQTSENYYRGLMSEKPLSNEEEFQFLMMMHGSFLAYQNLFLLAEEGTIDPEHRDSISLAISAARQVPGMHRYWRQRRGYLHPGFVEWVEQILSREMDTTMDIYRLPEPDPANK